MKKCPKCLKKEETDVVRFCKHCGAELFFVSRFPKENSGSKTITVSTRLPAAPDAIWEKLQSISTLQYITAPFASFKPLADQPFIWKAGHGFKFRLKIFGIFPIGIHTINVIQFDKETLAIYTNESNKHVPVWNHRIILVKQGDTTDYTDEVEIYAGWKTFIVVLWSKLFYRHRQRKWLKLLQK